MRKIQKLTEKRIYFLETEIYYAEHKFRQDKNNPSLKTLLERYNQELNFLKTLRKEMIRKFHKATPAFKNLSGGYTINSICGKTQFTGISTNILMTNETMNVTCSHCLRKMKIS